MLLESIALSILAATVTTTTAEVRIRVDERTPVAVAIVSPTGQPTTFSVSDVLSAVNTALTASTRTFALPAEASIVQCGGKLSCLAQLDPKATSSARLLILLTIEPSSPGDFLAGFVIDPKIVDRLKQTTRPEDLDAALSGEAVVSRPAPAAVKDQASLEKYARALVQSIEPTLARDELVGGWAQLRVTGTETRGASIDLDGRTVGVAGTTTLLDGLLPGRRTIGLRKPEFEPAEQEVELTLTPATVEFDLKPLDVVRFENVRRPIWIGGAAVAAVGAVMLTVGIVRGPSSVSLCVTDPCPGSGFARMFDSSELIDTRGVGPLAAPLGYSLIGAGAIGVLTDLLFNRDGQLPEWVPIVVGLGAGAVSYALSEALNPAAKVGP